MIILNINYILNIVTALFIIWAVKVFLNRKKFLIIYTFTLLKFFSIINFCIYCVVKWVFFVQLQLSFSSHYNLIFSNKQILTLSGNLLEVHSITIIFQIISILLVGSYFLNSSFNPNEPMDTNGNENQTGSNQSIGNNATTQNSSNANSRRPELSASTYLNSLDRILRNAPIEEDLEVVWYRALGLDRDAILRSRPFRRGLPDNPNAPR